MKKVILYSLLAAVLLSLPANAVNWDFLNPFSTRTTNITTTAKQTQSAIEAMNTLAQLQTQSQSIDNNMQNTFLSIVSKLSTPQETNTLKSKLASIIANQTKTEDERSNLINQLLSNYTSDLKSNKTDITSIIQNLSATDKADLIDEINTMGQYGQQYIQLGKQGASAASTILKASSTLSETAKSVAEINKAVSKYKTRATTVMNMANQIRSLAKYAGLSF